MRTREEEVYRRSVERMLRRERIGWRGLVAVQRTVEQAASDPARLWIRGAIELRVLAPGHGAGSGDVGKFWFVPGYSASGGPDVPWSP